MNWALWKRAASENWLQLTICSGLLILFGWAFVWLMSLFEIGAWSSLLNLLPNFVQPMLGVPLAALATPTGQISILYVHLITLLICIGWAIGQGSDAVSGEIARGTMEHLLTLPVRRVTVLVVPAVISTLGAALLAASIWVGSLLGLLTVQLSAPLSTRQFLPGALNLFSMTFCLAGVTTLISSCGHDRWRTIKLAGGFFIVSLIIKIVARMWPAGAWLRYCTFLSAFEPQHLILVRADTWSLSLRYNGTLLVLGLIAYAGAAVVLAYRDIPVPR